LSDVQQKVGMKDIYYAGSHGFEISGPRNFQWENKDVREILPVLDKIDSAIQKRTDHIKGVRLERKKYSIAVHYRQVEDREQSEIVDIIKGVALESEGIKIREGKKVIELQPDVDWDKGNAVEVLLREMRSYNKNILPVYLGDDLTDEDAFAVLPSGIKVLVGDHGAKTRADYHLNNTTEVKKFLQKLLNLNVSQ
jgi:trehalose-phosphatase